MDTRSGNIYNRQEIIDHLKNQEDDPDFQEHLLEIKTELTETQEKLRKIGRNELCPCGSGKKFKNCHWQCRVKYDQRFQLTDEEKKEAKTRVIKELNEDETQS